MNHSILDKLPRMMSPSPFSHRKALYLLLAGLIVIFLLVGIHSIDDVPRVKLSSASFSQITYPLSQNPSKPLAPVATPKNSTLGFGRIMMMIMPYRTDQRDSATLIARESGMDINIVDGVKPSDIPSQALPAGGWTGAPGKPGEVGCWRSHMDALQTVVNERLETALIFEADNDWDVRVKDQMEAISAHMPNATVEAPYGTDWDMLWLGQCISSADPNGPVEPIASWHDETVKPRNEQDEWSTAELDWFGVSEEQMRMLIPSFGRFFFP